MSADARLEALRAQWKEAERRMYPLATTAPAKYEQLVRIARQLADDLASVRTEPDLVAAWDDHAQRTGAAAAAANVPLGELSGVDVAGTGFALRDAEIRSFEHQRDQQQLVAAARARGDAWVRLHEAGDLGRGLYDPYQAIDLHLASGAAIVASVETEPSTGAANHVLTVIKMDPFSGVPTDIEPGIADVQEHADEGSFERARSQLVELIEAL
jgi:hypothetical protein